jgi:glutathione-dependent peroxiredoxin
MLKIISKPNCKYCNMAKRMLDKHNIPYNEKVIGQDITREEVLEAFPTMKTVPIIIEESNNQLIGGYTSMLEKLFQIYDPDYVPGVE